MEDISASDPADTPAKLHFNRTELSSVVNTRCSVTWREPSVCACATMSVCGHDLSGKRRVRENGDGESEGDEREGGAEDRHRKARRGPDGCAIRAHERGCGGVF